MKKMSNTCAHLIFSLSSVKNFNFDVKSERFILYYILLNVNSMFTRADDMQFLHFEFIMDHVNLPLLPADLPDL